MGWPLPIGEVLDRQMQEYARHSRRCGLAINTSVVIAAGRGMMNQDANQLFDNGEGIKLTQKYI